MKPPKHFADWISASSFLYAVAHTKKFICVIHNSIENVSQTKFVTSEVTSVSESQ